MFDLPKYGDGVCLARLAALLDALSIDRDRLQRNSVVVTGSNGKGSTAAFCTAIGRAWGLTTGLFTSPHLYRFNERFQIGGAPIDDGALARLVFRTEAAIAVVSRQYNETFGAFEAQFALACLYFQEADCDFAVFEAGIGGRYDPVRLVGAMVTCVTSVDFEHVELLGDTLQLICSDKSDACAAGGTIVYGENCRKLREHIAEYNRHRDVESLFIGDDIEIAGQTASAAFQAFDFHFEAYDFRGLETMLLGSFQVNNAAIAIMLFSLWAGRSTLNPGAGKLETAVRAALRETRWPGRLEVIARDPLTIIDVGHTPDAIRQALVSLKAIYGDDDWILVTGVSRDKNLSEIVSLLAPEFPTVICSSGQYKGADAGLIAAAAREANARAELHIAPTTEQAVDLSQSLAQSLKRKVYVAGSLFLATEYAMILRGGRAQDLRFF